MIRPKAAQTVFRRSANIVRLRAMTCCVHLHPELRRDHDLVAAPAQGAADEFFIREWSVGFRRVEECDATFERGTNQRNAGLLIDRWPIGIT